MKKIGEEMVLKGSVPQNTNGHRLFIFDGRYTTGYRILKFVITPINPTSDEEIVAKLHTSSTTPNISQWHFDNNQEFAWASWNAPTSSRPYQWSLVAKDNMVIEDLYFSNYHTGDSTSINYYIVIQKYGFSEWDGAGILVENLGQGGPQ